MNILKCLTNNELHEIVRNTNNEIVFLKKKLACKKCKSLKKELSTLFKKRNHVLNHIK